MSAIEPIVAVPIPNYAGEEAARPFDPDQPVTPIRAIRGVTAIESFPLSFSFLSRDAAVPSESRFQKKQSPRKNPGRVGRLIAIYVT